MIHFNSNATNSSRQPRSSVTLPLPPQLEIIGPVGLKQYISSLRHFMRRDTFQYTINEVMIENLNDQKSSCQNDLPTINPSPPPPEHISNKKLKSNERPQTVASTNDDTFGFTIQSIAFSDHDDAVSTSSSLSVITPLHPITTRKRSLEDAVLTTPVDSPHGTNCSGSDIAVTSTTTIPDENCNFTIDGLSPIFSKTPASNQNGGSGGCVSFILRTPPIPGKFLIEKAISLGIPKGPLYRQLKMGQDVSFVDAVTNERKVIRSSDVVEPSSPPIVIMILYYPTKNVARQLFASKYLQPNNDTGVDKHISTPELVIHITSSILFHQYGIDHWKKSHNKSNIDGNINVRNVDHIFLPLYDLKLLNDAEDNTSPFRSAMLGAYARSLIHPDIYECPKNLVQLTTTDTTTDKPLNDIVDEFHIGRPTMEYTILPRSKRGFVSTSLPNGSDDQPSITTVTDKETMESLAERSGACTLAQQIINDYVPKATRMLQSGVGELLFTGTASALPCKHRNVTGMLLKQSDRRSVVLDIGEGTMGQLLRMRSCEDRHHIYNEIKAVWISHPHADHHLGLMRLLKDRRQFESQKLLIIAPTPIFRFLDELSKIDKELLDSYIPIDCKDLVGDSPEFLPHQQTIQDALGITRCRAVPVAHCAHAYAVVLDGTSFGMVVYSGDCRPSKQLALIAKGADVLIHESTFENDMQSDAVLKKHSTIDEALQVGRQMECKCIVLTHFSQRYSKVPPLPLKNDDDYPFPIVYAYDCMKLQPHTLLLASKLTPALRLLFAEDTSENSNDEAFDSIESLNGADILSIPGAFANASLL